MIYKNRSVIASKRNSKGVTVYIPERMKISGEKYVVPFRLSVIAHAASESTIYSLRSAVNMTIVFSAFTILISDPFTKVTIQNAINYMQKKGGKRGENLSISRSEYENLL